MLSSLHPKELTIRKSKILHKSPILRSLTRFVTEIAVQLIFKIKFEDIYVVECWQHVVYVHAKGVSKFVSYADFPLILGVEPPSPTEMAMWRKRWQKQNDASQCCRHLSGGQNFLSINFGNLYQLPFCTIGAH